MNTLQIRIYSNENELLKTVTPETLALAENIARGNHIRLFAGDDDLGMYRHYRGRINMKWLEQARDNYNLVTLMRQALNGNWNPEQRIAVDRYLMETYRDEDYLRCRKSDRLFCYNHKLIQVFAVFGNMARQLCAYIDPDDGGILLPVIIDGQCLERDFTGDEGSAGGVAHLFYYARRQTWSVVEIDRLPWLWTDELGLSPHEITDRIATEIEMGHNVLTQKPAGWA